MFGFHCEDVAVSRGNGHDLDTAGAHPRLLQDINGSMGNDLGKNNQIPMGFRTYFFLFPCDNAAFLGFWVRLIFGLTLKRDINWTWST